MTIEEKVKAFERMIKDMDLRVTESYAKMDAADKKVSTHAGLIKEADLRQFKNEIRIG